MQILKFGHEDGEHMKAIWFHFPKLKVRAAAVVMIVRLPLKKKREREIAWSELYIWTPTCSSCPQLQQDVPALVHIMGGVSWRSLDGFYWIYRIWRCDNWVEASLATWPFGPDPLEPVYHVHVPHTCTIIASPSTSWCLKIIKWQISWGRVLHPRKS